MTLPFHSPVMSETCQYCDQSFTTSQDLGVHLNTEHKHMCWYTLCDKTCADKLDLQKHQRQKHKLHHPCPICWLAFNTAAELTHHLNEPTPSDRSTCKRCQKDVGSGEALWLHTYEQHKYYCPLGGWRCIMFTGWEEYDGHVTLRHHLFSCQYCHLVFRCDDSRREHVRQVHEVVCGRCDEVFVTEEDAHAHKRQASKCFVC